MISKINNLISNIFISSSSLFMIEKYSFKSYCLFLYSILHLYLLFFTNSVPKILKFFLSFLNLYVMIIIK